MASGSFRGASNSHEEQNEAAKSQDSLIIKKIQASETITNVAISLVFPLQKL
jgi:hypothetical protein